MLIKEYVYVTSKKATAREERGQTVYMHRHFMRQLAALMQSRQQHKEGKFTSVFSLRPSGLSRSFYHPQASLAFAVFKENSSLYFVMVGCTLKSALERTGFTISFGMNNLAKSVLVHSEVFPRRLTHFWVNGSKRRPLLFWLVFISRRFARGGTRSGARARRGTFVILLAGLLSLLVSAIWLGGSLNVTRTRQVRVERSDTDLPQNVLQGSERSRQEVTGVHLK